MVSLSEVKQTLDNHSITDFNGCMSLKRMMTKFKASLRNVRDASGKQYKNCLKNVLEARIALEG